MPNEKQPLQLLFLSVLIIIMFVPAYIFPYTQHEGLKDKIKKAKTFEDIFKCEKTIKLEAKSESYIKGIGNMLIVKNGDIIIKNNDKKSCVLIFDKNGKFKKKMANSGNGPGESEYTHSIAMDSKENIYLFDQTTKRINIYDQSYKFIKLIQSKTANQHLHFNKKDEMYLFLGLNIGRVYKCIEKVDNSGKVVTRFAEFPKEALNVKFYHFGDAMSIDNTNNIFVTNGIYPGIRKYDSNGKLLKEFGTKYVKMVTEKDIRGKSHEVARFLQSFIIFRDILIVLYSDDKADFYDTDGNLLNKNIPLNKDIKYSNDNELYLVESSDKLDNPIVYKYVVK
jgi:hypothetical protein